MIIRQDSLFGAELETTPVLKLCPPGVEIICDSGEAHSGVPSELSRLGATAKISPLDAGDYFIGGAVLIERKTLSDFTQSLYSGRLFEQIQRMKNITWHTLLIIEGGKWYFGQLRPKAIRMAYLSVLASWQMPIIHTRNYSETAILLAELGTKVMGLKYPAPKEQILHRHQTKATLPADAAKVKIIAAIPGIGPALANNLLIKFHSVKAISEASALEIAKVEGIGKLKAAKVIMSLT